MAEMGAHFGTLQRFLRSLKSEFRSSVPPRPRRPCINANKARACMTRHSANLSSEFSDPRDDVMALKRPMNESPVVCCVPPQAGRNQMCLGKSRCIYVCTQGDLRRSRPLRLYRKLVRSFRERTARHQYMQIEPFIPTVKPSRFLLVLLANAGYAARYNEMVERVATWSKTDLQKGVPTRIQLVPNPQGFRQAVLPDFAKFSELPDPHWIAASRRVDPR